ncbi:protein kinase [Akkermansiaceae bacterium]|nr:protein kinase [Akkermansiaceae bacterium]MDB4505353.1 protein kinase [bacterium]MDA8967082.1 protein kinase [Akkermansiaceae bacterium]MDB4411905.1 protein kinase [Akkermansiaceae bacterium]MDB4421612.1 protein kinase [Akkermansiaceae bacterium]
MEPPSIKGHTLEAVIGEGSAGVVYEARRDDGVRVAIKVLHSMGSNPALIRSRMARVMEGGVQNVTVPIIAEALEVRPACIVMPLIATIVEEEERRFIPSTLQTQIADYMQTGESWDFVVKLASRLAALHSVRVAHGNLKPGNIFVDEQGSPLLADYASGLMPGVHHLAFSDALLYAAPEQLRQPDDYLEEAGYRWDVYAFGVMAFQLLTGNFPRCQSVFERVCPAAGAQQRINIEADYEGIAAGLHDDDSISWPTEPADPQEKRRREMISFCLTLDPEGRPADMRAVARRFETIDNELKAEKINEDLVSKRKLAEKRRGRASSLAKLAALIALGLGGMWGWTEMLRQGEGQAAAEKFTTYQEEATQEILGLEEGIVTARDSENATISESKRLLLALNSEQKKSEGELRSAQLTNDDLFRWVLEKGLVGLPVLQNRQGRLALLAEQIEKQLAGMESRPDLVKQAAILRVRCAEVILASGQEEKGLAALEEAVSKAGEFLDPKDEAAARLRHLLLLAEQPQSDLDGAISSVEKVIPKAWPVDSSEKTRAQAALSLVKGRRAERGEKPAEALIQYSDSLKDFNSLAEQFPETPALRMTIGRAYLESALAAEGGGSLQNAASLRAKAAESFVKLAESSEEKIPEVEYQIAAANSSRAVAEWQKGNTFTAEILARQGVTQLTKIADKMPGDFRVTRELAAQQGIIATALRDSGRTTDASKLLVKAIGSMESGIDSAPSDYSAKYLLASLKWQLSGIVGQKGESEEEIRLGTEARDILNLILDAKVRVPQPFFVRKSLAYLCGDLGHSADLSGQRELGATFLKESQSHWDLLSKKNTSDEETREGLAWVKQRLRELAVK